MPGRIGLIYSAAFYPRSRNVGFGRRWNRCFGWRCLFPVERMAALRRSGYYYGFLGKSSRFCRYCHGGGLSAQSAGGPLPGPCCRPNAAGGSDAGGVIAGRQRAEGGEQRVSGIRKDECGRRKRCWRGKGPLAPICIAQERLKKNIEHRTSNIEC